MSMAIGKPQYGGKKKNNFRLQDGENYYRILPPLGELAADGVWAVYDSLHWGYKGSSGMRPFKCIQRKNFKTKMITQQCPECDKIAEKLAALEDQKKMMEAQGKSKEEIEEFLKPLADWLYSHNLDKKWYLNAMAKDGKIGRLAIPHKMYVQLQEVINDLVTKQGVDPIGVEGGVWFNLVRTGKGNQTSHRVEVEKESVMFQGRPMMSYKPAPLTEEVLTRLSAEAYDLKNAVRVLSYDEIQRIVSSNGDPDVVDGVFGSGEISKADAVTPKLAEADEPEPDAVASSKPSVNALPPAPTPVAPVVVAPTPVDPAAALKAQFEAQLAAMQAQFQAQLAATKSATPAPVVTPTPVSTDPTKLDDDMFIKQFGFSK